MEIEAFQKKKAKDKKETIKVSVKIKCHWVKTGWNSFPKQVNCG